MEDKAIMCPCGTITRLVKDSSIRLTNGTQDYPVWYYAEHSPTNISFDKPKTEHDCIMCWVYITEGRADVVGFN